jgi:hypothetical protein
MRCSHDEEGCERAFQSNAALGGARPFDGSLGGVPVRWTRTRPAYGSPAAAAESLVRHVRLDEPVEIIL